MILQILETPTKTASNHTQYSGIPQKTLDRILSNIPLADFTEDGEFGREEKEVEVADYVIFYTVSAYLFRTHHSYGYQAPSETVTWKATIEVDDLMIYCDEEEIEISEAQRDAIETQIKGAVEY